MRSLRIFLMASLVLVLSMTPSLAQSESGGGQEPGKRSREDRGPGKGNREDRGPGRGNRGSRSYGPPSDGQESRRFGRDRSGGGTKATDPNAFFDRMSGGKDVWKRSETDAGRQPVFDRIAEQIGVKNGEITRQQFVSYMENKHGLTPAPAGASGSVATASTDADRWSRAAEASFRALDKDGNGYLDYNEMPEDLRNERDKWDTDHNGTIDLNEYKAYYTARRQQRMADLTSMRGNYQAPVPIAPMTARGTPAKQTPTKPLVYTKANLPKELPSWFRELADADAQIAFYEWKAAGRSFDEFRKYDLNNDGFITVDEVLTYQATQAKKSSGGKPSFNVAQGGETVAGSPVSLTARPSSGSNLSAGSSPAPIRFDLSRFRNGGIRNRSDQGGGAPEKP